MVRKSSPATESNSEACNFRSEPQTNSDDVGKVIQVTAKKTSETNGTSGRSGCLI